MLSCEADFGELSDSGAALTVSNACLFALFASGREKIQTLLWESTAFFDSNRRCY